MSTVYTYACFEINYTGEHDEILSTEHDEIVSTDFSVNGVRLNEDFGTRQQVDENYISSSYNIPNNSYQRCAIHNCSDLHV